MNRTINMCVVSGRIGPQRRKSVSSEYDTDQIDFMIENEQVDRKGKSHKQIILCRVLGDKVRAVEPLKEGASVTLVGRIKYSGFKGYIQAWEAELGD